MQKASIAAHLEHLVMHIGRHVSHNSCPECRADNSRRFAGNGQPFRYAHVNEYLTWVKPRLEAIRTGENGGNTVEAIWWQRDFIAALHNRINSHIPNQTGRKYAPDYAKYHLATYGNDWKYLHNA